jgi:hypothetical protein
VDFGFLFLGSTHIGEKTAGNILPGTFLLYFPSRYLPKNTKKSKGKGGRYHFFKGPDVLLNTGAVNFFNTPNRRFGIPEQLNTMRRNRN